VKRKEAEDIRQTADVFDIRIAGLSKKAGFTLYRERPFFLAPYFQTNLYDAPSLGGWRST
jgi:hypothetical protein